MTEEEEEEIVVEALEVVEEEEEVVSGVDSEIWDRQVKLFIVEM
jgi:hypothetical protein